MPKRAMSPESRAAWIAARAATQEHKSQAREDSAVNLGTWDGRTWRLAKLDEWNVALQSRDGETWSSESYFPSWGEAYRILATRRLDAHLKFNGKSLQNLAELKECVARAVEAVQQELRGLI